jgi:hypothetical protein
MQVIRWIQILIRAIFVLITAILFIPLIIAITLTLIILDNNAAKGLYQDSINTYNEITEFILRGF